MTTDEIVPSARTAAPDRTVVPDRRPWRAAFVAAATVWSVTAVSHVAVSALAWQSRSGPTPSLWSMVLGWSRWDAGVYQQIADGGYHQGPGFPAFFPLYPLLTHIVDPLLPGGAAVSALVVANAAAFGALAVLHRLAEYEFGPPVARRAVWYLAAFPMGFFLFIGHNESLFLLLALGALYAGRRGHWWLAGTLGALSSATRLFGVLLILPLAVEYLRQREWRPHRIGSGVLALALIPLGAVAYGFYCWLALGDPLAFSAAQDIWGRRYTFPGHAWLTAISQMSPHHPLDAHTLAAILDAGTILVAVVLVILCVKGPFRFRRDQAYLVVHAVLTLVPLMSTAVEHRAMQSSPRYAMEAVAVFLVLARMGAHQTVDRIVLTTGVALRAVYLVVFMGGAFLVA